MKSIILLALCACLPSAAAGAEGFPAGRLNNWHQWRGPHADGTAPRGDPPVTWDRQKNIRWKAALLGRGSATPIVWEDQIFVVTAIDTGRAADPADLPRPDPRF